MESYITKEKNYLSDIAGVASICISLVLLFAIYCKTKSYTDSDKHKALGEISIISKDKEFLVLISVIINMSIVFSFNDGILVHAQAEESTNLASYSRLFYALGLICAGVIADIIIKIPFTFLCMCDVFVYDIIRCTFTIFIYQLSYIVFLWWILCYISYSDVLIYSA